MGVHPVGSMSWIEKFIYKNEFLLMFVYQPMQNICRYRTNISNKLPVRLIFIFSLNVIYENINGVYARNSRLPTRVAGRNETR